MQIHEQDSDSAALTLTVGPPQRPGYRMYLQLLRWHGTDTLVKFEGEVLSSSATTRWLFVLASLTSAVVTFISFYLLDVLLAVTTGSVAIGTKPMSHFILTVVSLTVGGCSAATGGHVSVVQQMALA